MRRLSGEPVFDNKKPVSETDEMRLCPFIRAAPEPVKGVNDARLLEDGPPKFKAGTPTRDVSIGMLT